MKILEFQHLIDEETQPDGQLYPVHWMMSSVVKHNFLLGMSVLYYYIQSATRMPHVPLDQETGERGSKGCCEDHMKSGFGQALRPRKPGWAVEHFEHLAGAAELRRLNVGTRCRG